MASREFPLVRSHVVLRQLYALKRIWGLCSCCNPYSLCRYTSYTWRPVWARLLLALPFRKLQESHHSESVPCGQSLQLMFNLPLRQVLYTTHKILAEVGEGYVRVYDSGVPVDSD